MPINVLCSHCETRFSLQDDLLGKKTICPVCREIFLVESAPAPAAVTVPGAAETNPPPSDKPSMSRADAPAPKFQTGSIGDFLNILPTEVAEVPNPLLIPADAPLLDDGVEDDVFTDFEVVEEEEPAPPGPDKKRRKKKKRSEPAKSQPAEPLVIDDLPPPKELVWSEHLALPPANHESVEHPEEEAAAGGAPAALLEPEADRRPDEESSPSEPQPNRAASQYAPDETAEFIRPRKKRGRLVAMVLLLLVTFGSLGTGAYYIVKNIRDDPERRWALALKEYADRNYDPARKLFEELAKNTKWHKHPEARFLAELCKLRVSVYSVANRTDPGNSLKLLDKFLEFIEDPAMQEFAAPGRYNFDIWETALKLTEDVAEKATKSFKRSKPDDAEPWLDEAVKLSAIVDRFRPADGDKENVFQEIVSLRRQIADARARLADLDVFAKDHVPPGASDDQIAEAREYLARSGYDKDPEFLRIVREAEKRIEQQATYKRLEQPIIPVAAHSRGSTSLLFAPRIGKAGPARPAPPGQASVFFALSRGVLYALNENDGRVQWATRTGIDSDTLPLVVHATDLHPELVLVVVNDGTRSTLTARHVVSGDTYWQQALPAAVIGKPVKVGQRLYVPLRDNPVKPGERPRADQTGVALEIEISNGIVTGRIALGRPIGGAAAQRSGTGQLFIPAELNGVYVFDVDRQDAQGARLDPAPVGIIPTGHPFGSLRGELMITAGDGDTPSYLIVGQADSLESMKLQAYPLSPPDQPPAIAGNLPAPIALSGWTWFSPYADSEKFAVVTDRGEFGLFGIKQNGNIDAPIFVLPPEPLTKADAREPARGQIIYADEENFWFLARGALRHLQIGFDSRQGLKLVPRGQPLPLGQPLHASQVNARADTAMVVTQASGSTSCRATAVDLLTGEVRWQRQLGLIAKGNPVRVGDAVVMMDHDGGIYQLDAKLLAGSASTEWVMDERWLVHEPLANVAGFGQFQLAADGKSVEAVLTTRDARGLRLTLRRYAPGQELDDRSATLPAPLAGEPLILGKTAIVPLSNGLLYRLPFDPAKPLEAGPTWRGERAPAQSTCYLTALGDEEFLASDGSRGLNRWRWSAEEFGRRGALTLSDRIGAAPLVLPRGDMTKVIVADVKSHVTVWDLDRFGMNTQPLRAWRPSENGPIPIGALTGGPYLMHDPDGKPRLLYIIDHVHIVWISPDESDPLWVAKRAVRLPGDGILGRPAAKGDRLYLTDRTGLYGTLDMATGGLLGEIARVRSSSPAAAGLPLDDKTLLAPLSDGTVLLLPMEVKKKIPWVQFYPIPPLGIPLPIPTMAE